MSIYVNEMIQSGRPVVITVAGQRIEGVITGLDNGFLYMEVANQGPRLINLTLVEQIIPKK